MFFLQKIMQRIFSDHNVELKKLDAKEHILCEFIYVTMKTICRW